MPSRPSYLRTPCAMAAELSSVRTKKETSEEDNHCNLSSAVPELWFCSSGGVCVCMRVCSEPLYL